jgi:hypothetical protein
MTFVRATHVVNGIVLDGVLGVFTEAFKVD